MSLGPPAGNLSRGCPWADKRRYLCAVEAEVLYQWLRHYLISYSKREEEEQVSSSSADDTSVIVPSDDDDQAIAEDFEGVNRFPVALFLSFIQKLHLPSRSFHEDYYYEAKNPIFACDDDDGKKSNSSSSPPLPSPVWKNVWARPPSSGRPVSNQHMLERALLTMSGRRVYHHPRTQDQHLRRLLSLGYVKTINISKVIHCPTSGASVVLNCVIPFLLRDGDPTAAQIDVSMIFLKHIICFGFVREDLMAPGYELLKMAVQINSPGMFKFVAKKEKLSAIHRNSSITAEGGTSITTVLDEWTQWLHYSFVTPTTTAGAASSSSSSSYSAVSGGRHGTHLPIAALIDCDWLGSGERGAWKLIISAASSNRTHILTFILEELSTLGVSLSLPAPPSLTDSNAGLRELSSMLGLQSTFTNHYFRHENLKLPFPLLIGTFPLWKACWNGNYHMVTALLAGGAEVHPSADPDVEAAMRSFSGGETQQQIEIFFPLLGCFASSSVDCFRAIVRHCTERLNGKLDLLGLFPKVWSQKTRSGIKYEYNNSSDSIRDSSDRTSSSQQQPSLLWHLLLYRGTTAIFEHCLCNETWLSTLLLLETNLTTDERSQGETRAHSSVPKDVRNWIIDDLTGYNPLSIDFSNFATSAAVRSHCVAQGFSVAGMEEQQKESLRLWRRQPSRAAGQHDSWWWTPFHHLAATNDYEKLRTLIDFSQRHQCFRSSFSSSQCPNNDGCLQQWINEDWVFSGDLRTAHEAEGNHSSSRGGVSFFSILGALVSPLHLALLFDSVEALEVILQTGFQPINFSLERLSSVVLSNIKVLFRGMKKTVALNPRDFFIAVAGMQREVGRLEEERHERTNRILDYYGALCVDDVLGSSSGDDNSD